MAKSRGTTGIAPWNKGLTKESDPKNSYLRETHKLKIENAQLFNKIRVLVLTEEQLSWKEIHAVIFQ